jgi:ribosomal protein L9
MKVILTDHVEHLGERGDSVSVKPGYARNYLLPKGLAYLDTAGNRKLFQQQQSGWEAMDLERQNKVDKADLEKKWGEIHDAEAKIEMQQAELARKQMEINRIASAH